MASIYNHKVIKLSCLIETATQKSIQIKLPSSSDWTKNLNSLLNRIPKKFKCLTSKSESEWLITINNTIINKNDPSQFAELLTSIPPLASIHIVESKKQNVFKIEYKSKSLTWIASNNEWKDKKEWNKNYSQLIFDIATYFRLYTAQMKLYVISDEHKSEITNGEDLHSVYTSNIVSFKILCEEDQIASLNQLKIHFKSSFYWTPPNPNIDDEKEWNSNYTDVINKIMREFNVNENDFKLKDVDECEINDGNDLFILWESLLDNKTVNIMDIYLVPNFVSDPQQNIISQSSDPVEETDTFVDEFIQELESTEFKLLDSLTNSSNIGTHTSQKVRRNKIAVKHVDSAAILFPIGWNNVCKYIHQDMWPKLASIVKSIIDDEQRKKNTKFDINNLSDQNIDYVIDILKDKRHLPMEERTYLIQLIKRCRQFVSITDCLNTDPNLNHNLFVYLNNKKQGINAAVLLDVFDV
eukprot:419849_1